jgi:hypothetical protein
MEWLRDKKGGQGLGGWQQTWPGNGLKKLAFLMEAVFFEGGFA